MRYLVCYDIADDRRRDRVAKLLLDYGRRLQESVFVADLDAELAAKMKQRLKKALENPEDKLHVFVLCEACWTKAEGFGESQIPQDPDFYVH